MDLRGRGKLLRVGRVSGGRERRKRFGFGFQEMDDHSPDDLDAVEDEKGKSNFLRSTSESVRITLLLRHSTLRTV